MVGTCTYLWHEVKGVRFLPGVVGGDCFVTRCPVQAKPPSIDSGDPIPTVPTWPNHLGPTRKLAQVSCKYVELEDVVFVPNITETRRSEIDTAACSTTCERQRTTRRAIVLFTFVYSFRIRSFECISEKKWKPVLWTRVSVSKNTNSSEKRIRYRCELSRPHTTAFWVLFVLLSEFNGTVWALSRNTKVP